VPTPPRERGSGADERSPIRQPADLPAQGGEALVEHLVERLATTERDLRRVKQHADAAERARAILARAARQMAEEPARHVVDLVRLALPVLGRWALVDLLAKGVATRHVVALDPGLARDLSPLAGPLAAPADGRVGLARALRNGRVERLRALPASSDDRAEAGPDPSDRLATLATGPVLVVPVTACGRVVAALTFGRAADEPEYDEEDQRLASDLAPIVALALEQRRTAETAAAAAQAKAQFLTMMSHELRTPLNAIAGYAQLLEMGFRGPLNESQRDAVTRIVRGQEHLLELVDAVLTFSRLTSGKLVLETTAVSAASLVDEASDAFVPQFSANGIDFQVSRCDAGVMVSADPGRALEVLRHLLANALKFTRRGGTVTLSCETVGGIVRLVVSDTGRGIPESQRESIFQPFVQVEKGLTRSVDGSGLGLAVGRELAERMGGTLTVDSEVGVGSRFVFALPRYEAALNLNSIDSPSAQG
jgi:signal transduction histidine kinase